MEKEKEEIIKLKTELSDITKKDEKTKRNQKRKNKKKHN